MAILTERARKILARRTGGRGLPPLTGQACAIVTGLLAICSAVVAAGDIAGAGAVRIGHVARSAPRPGGSRT
jgi:hypothetical protein